MLPPAIAKSQRTSFALPKELYEKSGSGREVGLHSFTIWLGTRRALSDIAVYLPRFALALTPHPRGYAMSSRSSRHFAIASRPFDVSPTSFRSDSARRSAAILRESPDDHRPPEREWERVAAY